MTSGHRAFDAYNAAGKRPGLTWDGKPVPGWEAVGPDVREKWEAAACKVENDLAEAWGRSGAEVWPTPIVLAIAVMIALVPALALAVVLKP